MGLFGWVFLGGFWLLYRWVWVRLGCTGFMLVCCGLCVYCGFCLSLGGLGFCVFAGFRLGCGIVWFGFRSEGLREFSFLGWF